MLNSLFVKKLNSSDFVGQFKINNNLFLGIMVAVELFLNDRIEWVGFRRLVDIRLRLESLLTIEFFASIDHNNFSPPRSGTKQA